VSLYYFGLMCGLGKFFFNILFSNLFAKAKTPRVITVAQVWNRDNIKIPLTRG